MLSSLSSASSAIRIYLFFFLKIFYINNSPYVNWDTLISKRIGDTRVLWCWSETVGYRMDKLFRLLEFSHLQINFIIWKACSLFIINSWMFHVNVHLLTFMKKWKMIIIILLIVYLFYIFVFNMSIGCCAPQKKNYETIHKSTAIFTQFITQKQHDFWVETTHGNKTYTNTYTLTDRTFNWK